MGGDGFKMSRFFVSKENISADKIIITGEDVAHIKKVLRLDCGDTLTLCDGAGADYLVRLEKLEAGSITAAIENVEKSRTEPPISVTLYQGLPKADKMELIIQKCVELGISRIVPVITERTVVRLASPKDIENKLSRWQRISMEAAKQCNRGIIPQIGKPCNLAEALKEASLAQISVIPYENETKTGLKTVLNRKDVKTAAIVIGPEGGFTEGEVTLAAACGVTSVSLGPRILRTETAGFAVLSVLMYELGDIGQYYTRKTE